MTDAGRHVVRRLSIRVALAATGVVAVGYLIVFGMGTIVGMTVITALLALPFTAGALPLLGWQRKLALGTGLLSLGFGLYLAAQVGLVDGLFLGRPVWSPR